VLELRRGVFYTLSNDNCSKMCGYAKIIAKTSVVQERKLPVATAVGVSVAVSLPMQLGVCAAIVVRSNCRSRFICSLEAQ
jgi:hypothetical protein